MVMDVFCFLIFFAALWFLSGMAAWVIELFALHGFTAFKPYICNVFHPWRLLREGQGGLIYLFEVLIALPMLIAKSYLERSEARQAVQFSELKWTYMALDVHNYSLNNKNAFKGRKNDTKNKCQNSQNFKS